MKSHSLAFVAVLALASTALGQTVTSFAPSTNTTPDVWYENDVRFAGTASIPDLNGLGGDLETAQPLPSSAALLTTSLGDTADKAEVGVFFDGTVPFGTPDDTFSTLSIRYSYHKASNPGQNAFSAPSLKLAFFNPVCDDAGSAGDCFGTLVYEPTWNQPGFEGSSVAVPTDTWTTVTITESSGLFWWTGGFGEPNTAGGPPLKTLADWKATFTSDFGDAVLAQLSIGVGTFNLGQIGYFDDVELSHSFGGGFSRSWDFEAPAVVNLDTGETFASIQDAIDDADTLDGDTLEMLVPDHTTPDVQTVFSKSVTLQGGSPDILRPSADTGTSGDARGWFLIPLGKTVTFRDLIFDGTGHKIHTAIRNHGTLEVADCEFTEIKFDESGPSYAGLGISHFDSGGAPMVVRDCTFSEMGRIGIQVFEPATIERCTYTGKGVGDFLDYFACVDSFGASIGIATFDRCTVSGNRGVASSDGSTSAGILITTFFGAGTETTITNSSFTDNTTGVAVGFDSADTSDVCISDSIIAGNDFGVINTSASVIVDAFDNWWGDPSGPDDPAGAMEADNPPCFSASFTPALDVINADGTGDSVTDANVDYCSWLLVEPPCLSVAAAENCTILTSTFEGPDLPDLNNLVVVHYNAGTTPGTADVSDVAFVEVRNAQFATNQIPTAVPDPENYALNAIVVPPTADGSNLPPALLTLDSMSGGIGEPGFGGLPARWTIDFYDGVNAPGDLAGSRFHTVLFGDAAEGICDFLQTFSSPEEQFAQTVYHVTDGIYHSVVSPEVDITTATTWDGSAFADPVPGLSPGEPFLYGENTSIDIGDFSAPALLTGSADPGFVTVWTRDACTVDTLAAVATNRLGLDIVDPQLCYKEGDILKVELNMSCLDQDVTGFFASVTYDPALLSLEPSSAYTSTPFSLHILDPIVDTGAPPGTILLDGSSPFGDPGTDEDALLATLCFEVLAGGDGVETSVAFTVGGAFPNELSFEGLPVPTRFSDPTSFDIDQSAPAVTCPPDMTVFTDLGLCTAAVFVGEPTATDACGIDSVVGVRSDALALDDPYPGGCFPGTDTVITWTVTDCAGNPSVCMQTVTVIDIEAPVQSGVPADITVNADAGACTAVVTYTDPTATDNCDGSPSVICSPPSGFAFPVGITTVTCTATDACGNTSIETFDVEVLGVNDVMVTVELVGVFETPLTRCIHFVGDDCGDTADVELVFTDHDSDGGTPVQATAVIEIPCGPNTMLCAKDEQHTEWDTTSLSIVGTTYVADTILSLEGGDTDNDGDCDINDVTLFIFQFGSLAADGGCPWDGATRDADFSNNGAVGSEDYSFLVANFLTMTACPCTGSPAPDRTEWSIPTARLPQELRKVDLNGDQAVDFADVRIFETQNGLPDTLSALLEAASR